MSRAYRMSHARDDDDQDQHGRNVRNRAEISRELAEALAEEADEEQEEEARLNQAAIMRMIDTDEQHQMSEDEVSVDHNHGTRRYDYDEREYTDQQYQASETQAILDSGADHTTIPTSLTTHLPWSESINARGNMSNIIMRYGNNSTLESIGTMEVGNYVVYIMPDEAEQPLVSLGEIVDNRHIVTLYPGYCTIQHDTGAYTLQFPRESMTRSNRDHTRQWMVPISVLHQLTLQGNHYQRDIEEYDGEAAALASYEAREQRLEDYLKNRTQLELEHEALRRRGFVPGLEMPEFIPQYIVNEEGKFETTLTDHKEDDEEHNEGRIPGLRTRGDSDNGVQQDDEHNHVNIEEDDRSADDNNVYISDNEDEVEHISRAFSARLHITPKTDREKVIDLHERMGHAPEDVMSMAVSGSHPEWINTGVTSKMIHHVYSKEA